MLLFVDYCPPVNEIYYKTRRSMLRSLHLQMPREKMIELIIMANDDYHVETLLNNLRRFELYEILANTPDIILTLGNEIIWYFDRETLLNCLGLFDDNLIRDFDNHSMDMLVHELHQLYPNVYEIIEQMFYDLEINKLKTLYYIQVIKYHLPSFDGLVEIYRSYIQNIVYISNLRQNLTIDVIEESEKYVLKLIKILNRFNLPIFESKIRPYVSIKEIRKYLDYSQN